MCFFFWLWVFKELTLFVIMLASFSKTFINLMWQPSFKTKNIFFFKEVKQFKRLHGMLSSFFTHETCSDYSFAWLVFQSGYLFEFTSKLIKATAEM